MSLTSHALFAHGNQKLKTLATSDHSTETTAPPPPLVISIAQHYGDYTTQVKHTHYLHVVQLTCSRLDQMTLML